MSMDQGTPRLIAVDPRRLPVRSVDYCRTLERGPAHRRINRSRIDTAGRLVEQWDPRLGALRQEDEATPANLSVVYSLSSTLLLTTSVDAGRQVDLPGLASENLRSWDGRGTQREIAYDHSLRLVAVFEQGAGQPLRCVERMKYGDPGQGDGDHNQHGQLVRHDDPAGTVLSTSFSLGGQRLAQERRFTLDAVIPDWPEREADREPLLEPGDGFLTTWCLGPQGDVLEQVDARGNRQRQTLAVDGRMAGSQLLLRGQSQWQSLVRDIRYSAEGQVEEQIAGNAVRTRLAYSPEDGRLVTRSVRHGDRVLQDVEYAYDPMGNVLSIEDKAQPVRYFANQRIEPVSRFVYDTLYQLSQATGWEAGAPSQGPESMGHSDPAAVSNYRQTYRYDEGGNLVELTHVGAQNHGQRMKVARHSNRGLPYRNGVPPTEEEIDAAFDAQGNWLEREPGRSLAWDLRNQLGSVTPIARASGLDDSERYVYAGDGQRVRKLRTLQTASRTLVAEVRYLPGLELRADSGNGESLQVIVARGGLDGVRILHWESTPPFAENDRYRYSCSDHLGSIALELDHDARIISREHFYPFGETAYLAGDDEAEVSYKTVRYSGKERDATGLYYYGFRYYAPWLQRWVNPDPAGEVDGLNLYRMVRNNPLTFFDVQGENAESKTALETAVGIFEYYQASYSALDRELPFRMMEEITGGQLQFKDKRAPEAVLTSTKDKKFKLRHYTYSATGSPSFAEISSNFALVKAKLKTIGDSSGNTNEKDWTRAGNMGFSFFLLAVDDEVNDRAFLRTATHFAEYDLEDSEQMQEALGAGWQDINFFASPDVLDPAHAANLKKVPMVKGRLEDLKALLLGLSGIKAVQARVMDASQLLKQIDNTFGGSLEIKIPGSVNVTRWHAKAQGARVRKAA